MVRLVRTELQGPAARIWLDSPENRNALSGELITELVDAFAWAQAQTDARWVVLGHTGNTFCAGVDLRQAGELDQDQQPAVLLGGLLRTIIAAPLPVVAAIDGHVRAGGMGLIGACDLAVATPRASFGLTEVRLGLAATVISVVVRPRLSDRAAAELFLGGDVHPAERLLEWGFLSAVADDLKTGLEGITGGIAQGTAQGLRETKRVLNAQLLTEFDARIDDLTQRSAALFESEQAQAAMAAFLQRRRRN